LDRKLVRQEDWKPSNRKTGTQDAVARYRRRYVLKWTGRASVETGGKLLHLLPRSRLSGCLAAAMLLPALLTVTATGATTTRVTAGEAGHRGAAGTTTATATTTTASTTAFTARATHSVTREDSGEVSRDYSGGQGKSEASHSWEALMYQR
jgi:hypothetical protein